MLVTMLVVTMIGVLTTLGMTLLQSRLEPWDDSRHFTG
jgi:ABC-type nitrate/sulfonate/bicarbonate transport system permease component